MKQAFNRIKLIISLLTLPMILISTTSEPLHAEETPLFIPVEAPVNAERAQPCRSSIPLAPTEIREARVRYVRLNPARLAALATTDDITLSLFGGIDYTAVRHDVLPRPSGEAGYLWTGTLAEVPDSSVILVVGDDQFYGRIGIPGRYLTIHQIEEEVYTVEQHELDAAPVMLMNFAEADTDQTPLPLPQLDPRVDDGSRIDLMVVYTPAAYSILERVAGSVALAVDGAVAHTNTIFQSSGIATRLNLVHLHPVFYLEQPNEDVSADLTHLMGKSDGYMDEVHPLRDQYAADLVAMISGVWFASYTGIAPAPSPLDEAKGFSITEACNIQDTTFTEQIGLNLGSARDFANANNAADEPVKPYGYGYQSPDGAFVTVMARRTGGECPPILTANVCRKVERFSTPLQSLDGQSLGADTADNVRSINELAVVVTNYRHADSPQTPTTELVINGGFEIDADADRTPDFWKARTVTSAKTACEGAGLDSLCALKIRIPDGHLRQKLITDVVKAGNSLLFSASVRTKKMDSGSELKLVIRYPDDTRFILNLPVPSGKNPDFQLLSATTTVEQTVKSIKVIVRSGKAQTGTFWVDEVSVQVYDTTRTG